VPALGFKLDAPRAEDLKPVASVAQMDRYVTIGIRALFHAVADEGDLDARHRDRPGKKRPDRGVGN
jgi:hypothetical protein